MRKMGVMSPTTKRRFLLSAIVLACGINACAVNDQGWETKPDVPALPAVFVDVRGDQLQRLCPPKAGRITSGCAVRNYALNRCFIYVEPNAPKWLAGHELAHCAGFDHQ